MFERLFPSRHVRDFRACLLGQRSAYAHHAAWDALEANLGVAIAAETRRLRRRIDDEGQVMDDVVADAIAASCLGDLDLGQDVCGNVMGDMARSRLAIYRQAIAQRHAGGRMSPAAMQAKQAALDDIVRDYR